MSRDVIVVGAGVAGLVAAAALSSTACDVLLLDRREAETGDSGADLALWPGAITILKALGVCGDFFSRECFSLDTVHMCNMDFTDTGTTADVLTTIDMRSVTDGTGESFALVARPALMRQLQNIAISPGNVEVLYGCNVTAVKPGIDANVNFVEYVDADGKIQTVVGRVVLGCDGARSRVRTSMVAPSAAPATFCGEMVYRGVLSLTDCTDENNRENIRDIFPDDTASRTMRINYGAGVRSSFGLMSGDGNLAYWWVKQPTTTPSGADSNTDVVVKSWPKILQRLYAATPANNRYVHLVESAPPLPSWSSPDHSVALAGDAAHLVTPNMGQGACLAVEDAFVLAVLLRDTFDAGGMRAALVEYERVRKPFADGVAQEARKQLLIGQLQWWPLVWLRERVLRNIPTHVLVRKLKANNFVNVHEYVARYGAQVKQYNARRT